MWDQYTSAYEDLLSKTSKAWAPWYIIPAKLKWVSQPGNFQHPG